MRWRRYVPWEHDADVVHAEGVREDVQGYHERLDDLVTDGGPEHAEDQQAAESHVRPQAPRVVVLEQEKYQESGGGDEGNEHEGVLNGARQLVAVRVRLLREDGGRTSVFR